MTTYRVIVYIPHPDRRFPIGMPANAMLLRIVAKNVVLIPTTALLREHASSSSFVVIRQTGQPTGLARARVLDVPTSLEKASIHTVSVRLLAETPSAVAVRGEIKAGDWILLNASSLVKNATSTNYVETGFKPNPEPSDLEFERASGPTSQTASTIPGPPPKGFLQQLLGR